MGQLVAKAQVVEQLVVQQVVKKGTLKAQEALAPTQLNLQLQHLARFGPPEQPLVPNNVEHSSEPLLHCSPSPSLAEVAQHTWKLGEVLRSQTSGQSKTNQWNRIVFHFSRHKVRLPAKSQVLFFEARQLCFKWLNSIPTSYSGDSRGCHIFWSWHVVTCVRAPGVTQISPCTRHIESLICSLPVEP